LLGPVHDLQLKWQDKHPFSASGYDKARLQWQVKRSI